MKSNTILPPTDPFVFERWCRFIAQVKFDRSASLYNIHKQNGIDVYWIKGGQYNVIQCKQSLKPDPANLKRQFQKDFEQSLNFFGGELITFIFATTASSKLVHKKVGQKDEKNQRSLIDLCNEAAKKTGVEVICWDWDFLSTEIADSPFLSRHLLQRVDGGDLIDDNFIEGELKNFPNIGEEERSKFSFYGGQDKIQWYGIIKGWDAPREKQGRAIRVIEDSFNYDYPVALIVKGDGGSGKSVFLRRLSYELYKKYIVYWIGSNIEAFLDNELIYDIKANPDDNFLIVLEDWYRNIENAENKPLAQKLLSLLKQEKNVRIIIGDRKGKKNLYDDFSVPESVIELFNTENRNLIETITKQMPDWRILRDNVTDSIFDSTLFVILFVFCHSENYEHIGLKAQYRKIFSSDFDRLSERNEPFYRGVAKLMYVYAILYSKYGISLTLNGFIRLAKFYSNSAIPDEINLQPERICNDSLLEKYIHIDLRKIKGYGIQKVISFHHDTMAELGWGTLHTQLTTQFSIGDLDLIRIFLKAECLWPDFERISFRQSELGQSSNENIVQYLSIDSPGFLSNYLSHFGAKLKNEKLLSEMARTFLSRPEAHSINLKKFTYCMEILGHDEIAKAAARNFLSSEAPYKFQNTQFLCLKLLKDEEFGKSKAKEFFNNGGVNINSPLYALTLEIIKDDKEVLGIAEYFWNDEKVYKNPNLFNACLRLFGNRDDVSQKAKSYILKANANLNIELFLECVQLAKPILNARELAKQVLEQSFGDLRTFIKSIKLEVGIIFIALTQPNIDKQNIHEIIKGGQYSKHGLSRDQIIISCLEIVDDPEYASSLATYFLSQNVEHYSFRLFLKCIKILKNSITISELLRNFIDSKKCYESYDAFYVCLSLLNDELLAEKKIAEYLESETPKSNEQIFRLCLLLCKDKILSEKVAREYLHKEGIIVESKYMAMFCMVFLGEKAEDIALDILNEKRSYEDARFKVIAIKLLSLIPSYNHFVGEQIYHIVTQRSKNWLLHYELIKTPLFEVPAWKKYIDRVIKNWEKVDHGTLTALIIAHFSQPETIVMVCLGIIRNWRVELTKNSKHKNHFIKSLANPALLENEFTKSEVVFICKHILESNEEFYRGYKGSKLEEILKSIVVNNQFPEWIDERTGVNSLPKLTYW